MLHIKPLRGWRSIFAVNMPDGVNLWRPAECETPTPWRFFRRPLRWTIRPNLEL
jgi:hypothetical protein